MSQKNKILVFVFSILIIVFATVLFLREIKKPTLLPYRINAGYWYTCFILDNKQIKCWGSNFHGQLGDGTFIDRLTPVEVVIIETIK